MYCDDIYNLGRDWTFLGTSHDVESVFLRLVQVLSAVVQATFVIVYLVRGVIRAKRDADAHYIQQGGRKATIREVTDTLLQFGTNRKLLPVYRYLFIIIMLFMIARALMFSIELWVIGFAPSHDNGPNGRCSDYSHHAFFTGNQAVRVIASIFRAIIYSGYEALVLNFVSLSMVELTSGDKVIRRVNLQASALAVVIVALAFFAHYLSSFLAMTTITFIISLAQLILTLYLACVLFRRWRNRRRRLAREAATSSRISNSQLFRSQTGYFDASASNLAESLAYSHLAGAESRATLESVVSFDEKAALDRAVDKAKTSERQPLISSETFGYGAVRQNTTAPRFLHRARSLTKQSIPSNIDEAEGEHAPEDDDDFGSDIDDDDTVTDPVPRSEIKDGYASLESEPSQGTVSFSTGGIPEDDPSALSYTYQALPADPSQAVQRPHSHQPQPDGSQETSLPNIASDVSAPQTTPNASTPMASPTSVALPSSLTFSSSLSDHGSFIKHVALTTPFSTHPTVQSRAPVRTKGTALPLRARLAALWLFIVGTYFLVNLLASVLFMFKGAYCGYPLCPLFLSSLLICVIIPVAFIYIFKRDTQGWYALHGLISTCGAESNSIQSASYAALQSRKSQSICPPSGAPTHPEQLERSFSTVSLGISTSFGAPAGTVSTFQPNPNLPPHWVASTSTVSQTNNSASATSGIVPSQFSPKPGVMVGSPELGGNALGNSVQAGSFTFTQGSYAQAIPLGTVGGGTPVGSPVRMGDSPGAALVRSPTAHYLHTEDNIGIAGTPIAAAAAVAAAAAQQSQPSALRKDHESRSTILAPSSLVSSLGARSSADPGSFSFTKDANSNNGTQETLLVVETTPDLASTLLLTHQIQQQLSEYHGESVAGGSYENDTAFPGHSTSADLDQSYLELALDDQDLAEIDIEDWLSMNGINVIPQSHLYIDEGPIGIGANAQVLKAIWFPNNPKAAVAAASALQALEESEDASSTQRDQAHERALIVSQLDKNARDVALKQLFLSSSVSDAHQRDFNQAAFAFCREAAVSQPLRHENVVQLLGIVVKQREKELSLALEYCSHGPLASLLQTAARQQYKIKSARSKLTLMEKAELVCTSGPYLRFTWRAKLNLALGIAKGIQYLHSHRLVHRDLKTDNVLIHFPNLPGNPKVLDLEYAVPKLADFGHARLVTLVANPEAKVASSAPNAATDGHVMAMSSSLSSTSQDTTEAVAGSPRTSAVVGSISATPTSPPFDGHKSVLNQEEDKLYRSLAPQLASLKGKSKLFDNALREIQSLSASGLSSDAFVLSSAADRASDASQAAAAAAAAAAITTASSGLSDTDAVEVKDVERERSQSFDQPHGGLMSVRIGTQLYSAPEILYASLESKPTAFYGYSADVYSFGIMLWEIANCKQPFSELNNWNNAQFCLAIVGGHRPVLPPVSPLILGTYDELQQRCTGQEQTRVDPTAYDDQEEMDDQVDATSPDADASSRYWTGTLLSKRIFWQLVQKCWCAHASDRPSFDQIVKGLEAILALHDMELKALTHVRRFTKCA